MNEIDASSDATSVDNGMVSHGIRNRLLRSHLVIGLLGVVVLATALVSILWLRESTRHLTITDGPTVRFSTLAQSGVHRSLAALEGWVVLGEPTFRQQREDAWSHEIRRSIAQLDTLSIGWARAENQQRFGDVKILLDEFEDWQWWVEDVAQTPGNKPANVEYTRDIEPIIARLKDGITAVINMEVERPSGDNVSVRLKPMADFRFSMTASQAALVDFIDKGSAESERSLVQILRVAEEHFRRLSDRADALTMPQQELLAWMEREVDAYLLLAAQVMTLRNSDKWSRARHLLDTEVNPRAEKLTEILTSISREQTESMNRNARIAANVSDLVVGVLSALVVVMAVSAYLLSSRSAHQLTEPIRKLVDATERVAARTLKEDIPVTSSDELGRLTASFNRMRRSLNEVERILVTRASELEHEVSERKRAEEQFRLVVEAAPNAIVAVDEDGIIQLVNAEAEKLFGYSRQELVGESIEILVPPRFREEHPKLRRHFFENPQQRPMGVELNLTAIRQNGEEFPVEIGLNPMHVEKGLLVLSAIVDVTDRKRAEAALRHSHAELERSNADLEQFAYVASHDLQEPLRAVAGFADLLRKQYVGQLDEKADQYIYFLVDGAKRMQTLVRNLLDYSRVGTHGKEFERANCQEVIDLALRNLRTAIQECGAELCINEMPTVAGDKAQLVQLFQNLVGNAIKFHGQDVPRIDIDAVKSKGEWVFCVRDNGIGVKQEHTKRIFVIFQRLHARDKYPGTGIGLSICQRIVQRHGGRIWVESSPGQGSSFYFTLPV